MAICMNGWGPLAFAEPWASGVQQPEGDSRRVPRNRPRPGTPVSPTASRPKGPTWCFLRLAVSPGSRPAGVDDLRSHPTVDSV